MEPLISTTASCRTVVPSSKTTLIFEALTLWGDRLKGIVNGIGRIVDVRHREPMKEAHHSAQM